MKETTLDNSIESKRRRRRALKKTIEKIMNAVFFVCGAAAIAAVALITVYMVVSGPVSYTHLTLPTKRIV